MTDHPVNSVFVDNVAVSKSGVRSYEKDRNRIRVPFASYVQARNLGDAFGVDIGGAVFDLDTSDTTSPDDGYNVLVDLVGNRFVSIPGSVVLSYLSANYDKTNDSTLSDSGLSVAVQANKLYRIRANLFTTSSPSGGVKVAIGGTAVPGSLICDALTINAGTITQGRATSQGTAIGAVTAVTNALILMEGMVLVGTSGTLTVQFAQNAIFGVASSILANSILEASKLT